MLTGACGKEETEEEAPTRLSEPQLDDANPLTALSFSDNKHSRRRSDENQEERRKEGRKAESDCPDMPRLPTQQRLKFKQPLTKGVPSGELLKRLQVGWNGRRHVDDDAFNTPAY